MNYLEVDDTISFLNSPQMRKLDRFYADLRAGCANGQWDVLILVTRKGFWMYNIITEYKQEKEYSDRYLMKTLERSFVDGKRICLVDDTLSNGYSMFRYYCILKMYNADEITPYVYALSTSFPRNTVADEMLGICKDILNTETNCEAVYAEFCRKLKCYRYMSQDNISRFCLAETEFFQQILCPMVVNLPMMVSRAEGSVLKDHFIMDAMQFAQLAEGDSNWSYIRNEYGFDSGEKSGYCITGCLEKKIQCNYFVYTDSAIERLKESFLQNLVVKCKYNINREGKYCIAFTPFAIVRSMKKAEVKKAFQILMGGTEYGKELLAKLEKDLENNLLWIAAMRSVIYILSRYAGEKFREYLGSFGFTDSGYDERIMLYHEDELFIASVKELDTIRTVGKLLDGMELEDREHVQLGGFGAIPSMTDVYEVIHWEMLDTADRRYNEDRLDIDKIEAVLAEKFSFSDYESFALTVSGIILALLEISVCGNHLYVKNDMVWRGFRHGENTKLLLPSSGRLCYICAEVLYITLGEEKYKQILRDFLNKMKEHLQEIHAFTGAYEEEYFDKYAAWFVNKREDAKFHILGKEFLLDRMNEKEAELHDYAVWAMRNREDTI